MCRTEFLAVGCEDQERVAACLERQGWSQVGVLDGRLTGADVSESYVECSHPDTPVLLLLVPGRPHLRVTGVRRGGSNGTSWLELITGTPHQLRHSTHDAVLRMALACSAAPALAL